MVGKLLKLHTKAHNQFLKQNHRASSRAVLEHRSRFTPQCQATEPRVSRLQLWLGG